MTTLALPLLALSAALLPVGARASAGPENFAQEAALFGRFQGALGLLRGEERQQDEWKPVAAGPVMDAPAAARPGNEAGPCQQNRSLDSTAFFLMLTPPDKRRPFTSLFTPESCVDGDRDGRPGKGEPRAIRTYRGNKAYDLLLVTRQGGVVGTTEIFLIHKLPDGGREVAGSLGSVPTTKLLTAPVRTDQRQPVRVMSDGVPMEGTAELMPKSPN